MEAFADDLGDDGPPFKWDEERRALLRAELDAAYFHLYGIEAGDADYILDTFPIVKRKDEQRYGEYRTKRLILEIYDAMAKAIKTGEPYQTILDPPPGQGPAIHNAPYADGRGADRVLKARPPSASLFTGRRRLPCSPRVHGNT